MDLVREFSTMRQMSRKQFEVGLHRVAFAIRPFGRRGQEFTSHLVPLREIALYVQRRQYLERGGIEMRSCPTMAFRPRHNVITGEIVFDERGCVEAYDAALPPDMRNAPHFLNVQENRRVGRLAAQMFKMVQNAKQNHLMSTPPLPSVYFGFRPNRPPRFEASVALRHAAVRDAASLSSVGCNVESWDELVSVLRKRAGSGGSSSAEAVDAAVTHLTREVLKETWNRYLLEHNGFVLIPQVFLFHAPEVTYDRHPILGTTPPEAQPRRGDAVDGWAEVNGRWVPQAQRPDAVFVDISPYLGVLRRNMAYRVLLHAGLISDPTFEDFRERMRDQGELERYRERFQTMTDEQIDELQRSFVRMLGASAKTATEKDIGEAFLSPQSYMWHSLAMRVNVVELTEDPSPEALTFACYGLRMDVYRARAQWQHRFESSACSAAAQSIRTV